LLLVAASMFIALVFSYLYIWTVSPQVWPAATGQQLPEATWPFASAAAFVFSSAAMVFSGHSLSTADRHRQWPMHVGITVAIIALTSALFVEFQGHWQTALRPAVSSYGALVYTMIAVEAQLVAAVSIMGLYTIARGVAGMLTPVRRATFDNTMLLWHYTVAQGLVGLLIVHGFPRVAG
jgi:cytochrome c oxidase subunit I+III